MFLAARGLRERDAEGPPRYAGEFLVALERQAWRVVRHSLLTGLALTAAAVLWAWTGGPR